ncbi:hypothetical protein AHF37_06045 [Paragonimus kellicotti]|nr:hypothetical protein AHF37_06045 [Paragonimus kellicotti]
MDTSVMLMNGYQVAFLTTDISRLLTDLSYYRPTIFVAVPRILSRMYTDTIRGIGGAAWIKWLFNLAIQKRLNEQKRGIFRQSGLLDYFFFRKMREQLGCCVSLIVCGSAPLQTEVLEFIKAAFSCVVSYGGYGSTECGGLVTATLPLDPNSGHAGAIVMGVKVKLVDVPSMNFIVERDGMGEVCVMSNACTTGYYKNETDTNQLFDNSGFTLTGDVGRWTEVKAIHLCSEPFSIANGLLTPTMKVSRPAVRRHFSEAIAKLYQQN